MAIELNKEELSVKAPGSDDCEVSRLMLRFYNSLASFIAPRIPRHLRCVVDVDDILQETFIKAWRAIGSFASRASFPCFSWLAQTAKNTLIDTIRANERAKRDCRRVEHIPFTSGAGLIDFAAAEDRNPMCRLNAAETEAALSKALRQLKEKHREVLVMRYLDGLSIARIASFLETSEGAISMRLHRAIQKLRALLLLRGDPHPKANRA